MNPTDTTHANSPDPVNETPANSPSTPLFCFSMVLADVIFQTEKGVEQRRVQFLNKSTIGNFPASRMGQLQNAAAMQAQQTVPKARKFKVLEVFLLNFLPLGWMTDLEFYGAETLAQVEAEQAAEAAPPEAENTSANDDNVVPLHGN